MSNIIGPFKGKYRFLSNFYLSTINFDGIKYPTVEHAYQAQKTLDKNIQIAIASQLTPGQARMIGKNLMLRPGWEGIKLGVMKDLVFVKFRTHEELRNRLISTGDAELIELNHWGDRFWGMCNGIGENNLGRILMKIREQLR